MGNILIEKGKAVGALGSPIPANLVSYNGSNVETALDKLNADITTVNIVTYTENASYPTLYVSVKEKNGMVFANIILNTLASDITGGWAIVGTLSAAPMDSNGVFLPCFDGASGLSNCLGYAHITASGEVRLHGGYAKTGTLPVIYGSFLKA